MEVYIIANIRNYKNKLIGYRLLNIGQTVEIKDVTKLQLLYVMKDKGFKLENAKVSGNKITGIYHSLDSLCNRITHENDINKSQTISSDSNKIVILKQLINKETTLGYTAADSEGKVKNIRISDIKNMAYLYNIINYEIIGEKSIVKAKKENLDVVRERCNKKIEDRITDEEARNPNIVWNVNRFMKYMEQNNYKYVLKDNYNDIIDDNSETFVAEKYAKYNNFSISVHEIDKNCKIIHLPYGVSLIASFYKDYTYLNNIEIDTIIIPSTVIKIRNLDKKMDENIYKFCKLHNIQVNTMNDAYILYRYINCKRLFFQPDMTGDITSRDYSGFSNMNITEDLNIFELESYKELKNNLNKCIISYLLNNSTIPYVPKPKINELSISDSFCNTDIKGNCNVDLTGYYTIYDCFNGVDGIDILKIGNTVNNITKSFRPLQLINNKEIIRGMYLPRIDFKDSNVSYIVQSFWGFTSPVTNLDISEAKELVKIDNSFINVDNITEIILPQQLRLLMNKSFEKADKVNELILPNNINFCTLKIGKGKTRIVFPKGFYTEFSMERVGGSLSLPDILRMPSNFTEISKKGLLSTSIERIINTENIEMIGDEAFAQSCIEEIDFRNFPKIRSIPNKCFRESDISTVIISCNIHRICAEAFSNCSKLRKVFISKDVEEIQTRAFYKCATNNNGVATIYTVKNSEAYRYFKNKKNFSLLLFDNDEEAIRNMNVVTASDGQKDKFRFVNASSNEYDELKYEPYLSNCGELMKLHKLSKSECSPYEGIIDESIFDFDGPCVDIFKELNKDYNKFSNITDGYIWDGKYTKQFAGYCMMLSKLAKNNMELFKSSNAVKNFEIHKFTLSLVLYRDLHCCIAIAKMLVSKQSRQNRLIMVVITINKQIVWCAPFEHSKAISSLVGNYNSFLGYNYFSNQQNKNNFDITSKLKIGDWYVSSNDRGNPECIIGGMLCPASSKYTDIFVDIFNYDLRIIEFDSITTLINKAKITDVDSYVYTALMYSLTNHKVYTVKIKCTAKLNENISFLADALIDKIEQINIIDIEDLNTAIKCKNKHINMKNMLDAFRDEHVINLYRLNSLDEQKIEQLFKAKDAFYKADYKDDNKIYAIGKVLKENNIKNIEVLSGKQLRYLLKSGLCIEMDTTLKVILKKFEDRLTIKTLSDSEILFIFNIDGIELKRDQNIIYIYAVVNINENYNKVKVYESHLSLQVILDTLKSITCKLHSDELHEITDKDVDTRDFQWIASTGYGDGYGRMHFDIAIQNETCEWFLIANRDDISYITLFRFKSLKDAEEFLFEYENNKISHENILHDLARIAHEILSYRENYGMQGTATHLLDIREEIMKGLPENWPTHLLYNDLFKLLPKQRGKESLKYER